MDELERLRDLVADVQRMLVSRPTIDHAVGILIATEGLSPGEGFDRLRAASQRLNMPVREVARRLVARYQHAGLVDRSQAAREASERLLKETKDLRIERRAERKLDVDGKERSV